MEFEEKKIKIKNAVDKNIRMNILKFHTGNFDLGLKYIKDNDKLLDFGCGIGYFFDYLIKKKKRKNVEYVGYDTARYKENYDFPFYTDLKKIKDKFDIITMFQVIEHIKLEEMDKLLDWIKEHLKEDGMLIITTDNIENPFIIFWQNRAHVQPYSLWTLKEMMLIKGFNIVRGSKEYLSKNPFKLLFGLLTQSDLHSRILVVVKR